MPKVTVIGAGAVGLSSALQILTELPQCEVTVIADKFDNETTSHGAAGIFCPVHMNKYTTDRRRMATWYKNSFDRFWQLIHSGESYKAGVGLVPLYYFLPISPEDWKTIDRNVLNLRPLRPYDIEMLKLPQNYTSGFVCDSLIIEGRYLLPYLLEQILKRGGKIINRTISSPDELSEECDVIVNCSGLRARELFNDDKVYPIRGQVMRVHAPWIKHTYMGLDDTYVIPVRDSVVVGGCKQFNSNLQVNQHEVNDIWERTMQLVPTLKHASVIEHWVGLRPGRDGLRLELDMESCRVPVVHNYGHAAKGIALSHGTAVEATEIVKKVLLHSKL